MLAIEGSREHPTTIRIIIPPTSTPPRRQAKPALLHQLLPAIPRQLLLSLPPQLLLLSPSPGQSPEATMP